MRHQDRHNAFDDLELLSQLNCKADALATNKLNEYRSPKPTIPLNPTSLSLLHVHGRTVTHDIDLAIHRHLFLPPLRTYYISCLQ
jgi:hypothetical protein